MLSLPQVVRVLCISFQKSNFAGRRCLILLSLLIFFFFLAATIEGELFCARPHPPRHPYIPLCLLEGYTVVMGVRYTWNLSTLSSQWHLPYQIAYIYLFSIWDCCILVPFCAYVCILWGALAVQGKGWILCWFKLSCSHLSLLLFTDAL